MNLTQTLKLTVTALSLSIVISGCGASKTTSQLMNDGLFLSAKDVTGAPGTFTGTWTSDNCAELKGSARSTRCNINVVVNEAPMTTGSTNPPLLQVTATVLSDVADLNAGAYEDTLTTPSNETTTGIVGIQGNILTLIQTPAGKATQTSNIGKIGQNAFVLQANGVRMAFQLISVDKAKILFSGFGAKGNGVVRTYLTLQ